MKVIESLGYTSLALVVVVAILIVIVNLIEKKLNKLVIKGRNKRDIFYQEQFKAINKADIKKTIEGIDRVARNFFAEAFQLNKRDYTDFKNAFKKNNNKKAEEFSKLMIEIFYSKEKDEAEESKAL